LRCWVYNFGPEQQVKREETEGFTTWLKIYVLVVLRPQEFLVLLEKLSIHKNAKLKRRVSPGQVLVNKNSTSIMAVQVQVRYWSSLLFSNCHLFSKSEEHLGIFLYLE
jgi:hypothetical protein